MTTKAPPGRHLDPRRLWLHVALGAAAAAVVLVAVAVALFHGSATTTQGHRGPAAEPRQSDAATGAPSSTSPRPHHQRHHHATPPPALPVPATLPRSAPMSRSVPTRLLIPAIGVDSDLMSLGLKHDGTLETPPGAFPAGWFTGAPTPGQLGPAIIVGHVRYNTPGVFARLSDLRHNEQIEVKRADGSTASFQVTSVEHFAKSAFPTQEVYGNLDHAGLRLITCGGLDAKTNDFEENVVVFADLVVS